MQTENRDNQARAAEMEREMDALRNALESSRRNESESQKKLQALKVSNESITKEVSLMRSQLEKVTQSAAAVQDRYRSERAKFEGKEATQQRTIDALSARIADESDRHCQTARQLAQAESIAKEARVQLAAFEDAKKQLRAAQLTEEQLSAHIEKLVGELKTSEASRSESKREAADASAELVDVTAEKEKAEADVAALRKKVEEGKAKISTLRRDVQAARYALRSLPPMLTVGEPQLSTRWIRQRRRRVNPRVKASGSAEDHGRGRIGACCALGIPLEAAGRDGSCCWRDSG